MQHSKEELGSPTHGILKNKSGNTPRLSSSNINPSFLPSGNLPKHPEEHHQEDAQGDSG